MNTNDNIILSTNKTWSEANFQFSTASYTWGDIQIAQEIADVVSRMKNANSLNAWQEKEPEKKTKAIKLYCKVLGIQYDATKYPKEYKLNVSQVKIIAENVLKINIEVDIIY